MVLYPWPEILGQTGLYFTYKPREVWWKDWIKRLGLKKEKVLLEVGCGRGVLLDRLASEYGVEGYGIDISKKAITEAKENCIFDHDLRVADACNLPFSDRFFDIVISFDTLEHIRNQEKAIEEMIRVLKPKGRILIYTINKKQKWTWNWLLEKFGVDVYRRVGHDPEFLIDPKELKLKLEQKGIMVTNLTFFNSFFTLACDEVIMVFILILTKIGLNKKRYNLLGRFILFSLTGFSKIATPFLNFLDTPWRKRGHSNSFLLIGEEK